jgi:hypothetical protein
MYLKERVEARKVRTYQWVIGVGGGHLGSSAMRERSLAVD